MCKKYLIANCTPAPTEKPEIHFTIPTNLLTRLVFIAWKLYPVRTEVALH